MTILSPAERQKLNAKQRAANKKYLDTGDNRKKANTYQREYYAQHREVILMRQRTRRLEKALA
jgi:hypothetical protein